MSIAEHLLRFMTEDSSGGLRLNDADGLRAWLRSQARDPDLRNTLLEYLKFAQWVIDDLRQPNLAEMLVTQLDVLEPEIRSRLAETANGAGLFERGHAYARLLGGPSEANGELPQASGPTVTSGPMARFLLGNS